MIYLTRPRLTPQILAELERSGGERQVNQERGREVA